jgi:hypothetical protein
MIKKMNTKIVLSIIFASFFMVSSLFTSSASVSAGAVIGLGPDPTTTCPISHGLEIPQPCDNFGCDPANQSDCIKYNPLLQWIRFFINVISSIIIVGAIVMVTLAGLEYSASGDNSQTVQNAKKRITNVMIGLVSYFFLYAFLQWVIPGGVF